MSLHAVLFAFVAAILSFIFAGGWSELFITNVLLGIVAGTLISQETSKKA